MRHSPDFGSKRPGQSLLMSLKSNSRNRFRLRRPRARGCWWLAGGPTTCRWVPWKSAQKTGGWRDCCLMFPRFSGLYRGSELTAEMLRLVVPWLIHEHDNMTVTVLLASGDPVTNKAARVTGMKVAYILREAIMGRDGTRRDLECWQALHPTWLARLGRQPEAVLGNIERDVRSPARFIYKGRNQDPPLNATIVGERLYMRPIEQADSDEIARWSMRETDTAFDIGRSSRSPISYWHWNRKNSEAEPPSWIRFAICLRSDHSVIGANGLAFVDWIHRTAETETEIVRPDFRGSGYGTEAKHLMLEFAFERIGLHMVRSMAWAFNTRSCEALRKQGYRDAGRLAWTGIKSGDFADDLVFDLLAEEWRAARVSWSWYWVSGVGDLGEYREQHVLLLGCHVTS